jgi:outer membrane protein
MCKSILSLFLACWLCAAPVVAAPQVSFQNSSRLHDLMRAGNLYLSLQDALALAIENNLDIELERYLIPQGDAELLRAKGGGTLRGLNFTIAEVPVGVGGPLSPVVTSAASVGRATGGTSVASNALELGVLGEPLDNYSIQGTIPQSNGSAVPIYDPIATGLLNFTHQSTPQTNFQSYGTNALVTNTTTGNAGIGQGFASGAVASASFTNYHTNWNPVTAGLQPFSGSALGITVTQPLMRGFGVTLNRRYIRIASNERKITSLLFQQQLIATVYGVIRLYTDFVALTEDEKVKQETVTLAEKLQRDTQAQVDVGTLARIELTRAGAQVYSTRQDLINAHGLVEEQEAILKTVLTRRGSDDPEVRAAHIIPTDILTIPANDDLQPMQDLISGALQNRPDVNQAQLQVENSVTGLTGARNATLPQVDLVGTMQNSGLAGTPNSLVTNSYPGYNGGYANALEQVFARNYPTYGIGLQVTLPIHNRIAEADLARDELQLKQSQVRLGQLQNQARLEVEDALIAMRRARASYQAASEARRLQEESLAAEETKFQVGSSTSFFVIQYASMLAQAKSTEVAAQSSYVKARAALQRATGTILDQNKISFDAAIRGKM